MRRGPARLTPDHPPGPRRLSACAKPFRNLTGVERRGVPQMRLPRTGRQQNGKAVRSKDWRPGSGRGGLILLISRFPCGRGVERGLAAQSKFRLCADDTWLRLWLCRIGRRRSPTDPTGSQQLHLQMPETGTPMIATVGPRAVILLKADRMNGCQNTLERPLTINP